MTRKARKFHSLRRTHPIDELGFTLIELLVVISIIAILAAMLFPVLTRAKAAAGDARTISNTKQLGAAELLYQGDFDDLYSQATDGLPGKGLLGGWVFYSIYNGNGAGVFNVRKGTLFSYCNSPGVYLSSGDPDAQISGNSFAINGHLGTWTGNGLNPGVSESLMEFPASTMLFGEEGTGSANPITYGYTNGTNDGYFNPIFDHFARFHPGGSDVVYCDGHAKIVPAEDRFVETICGSKVACF